MKLIGFSTVITSLLVASVWATPASVSKPVTARASGVKSAPATGSGSGSPTRILTTASASASPGCGAAGSCVGLGGGELCNDRCKHCSGPSGQYSRGACCGIGLQTCCCYYS